MKKNLIITVLAIVCIISIVMAVTLYKENKKADMRYAELVQLSGKTQIITQYIRDSIPHTVFKDKLIKDTALERRLALSNSYADSLEKALKLSINKITQASKVNAQLEAKIKMTPTADAVTYQDKWLQIQYYPLTQDLELKYDISLNVVRYADKKWFLGKKQHYIDVFADDSRVKIKSLNTFTIEERPAKRFGFGISAGYGFTLNDKAIQAHPYIGVGFNYNLIHF
ncbi:DUF6808 domain-containing protein [Flavobacterium sp. HSC-61S13]|uniref:DUF6808 domain-containing protein n=1 Tax=Flavobacterium sp. HSC-61S13 TaxID=2910963 RepID=UPI00209EB151|nr:hypothetical protein [Flavobacterium sp. HSC-61S13]MCP1997297.1 hypothetical protein [Flavobacterium sp. HSC-61S13]